MKQFILCADDYALNPQVNAGILKLLEAQRLSAVSCMVLSPHWTQAAQLLKPFHSKVDVGLHFDLTEFFQIEGRPYSLKEWILLSHYHKFLKKIYFDYKAELLRQLDFFIDAMGVFPDFIDGHQHIHVLPGIRQVLCQFLSEIQTQYKAYIRIPGNTYLNDLLSPFGTKKLVINFLGALKTKKLARHLHLLHNESFAGIYDLKAHHSYRKLFQSFVKSIRHKGMIMCHPAEFAVNPNDPIYEARWNEFLYLYSQEFVDDLHQMHCQIGKFDQINFLKKT